MFKALLNFFRGIGASPPRKFDSVAVKPRAAAEPVRAEAVQAPPPTAPAREAPASVQSEQAPASEQTEQAESAAPSAPLSLEEAVVGALRGVFDPEIPVNVYDLGLIYDINIEDPAKPEIKMTLTSPNCPEAEAIPVRVQQAVESVQSVEACVVEIVWEPPWTPDKMSEAAKLELDMF